MIEYNELTEIDFSVDGGWLLNFGAGTPIEAATVTTAALTDPTTAEPWEGVLIKLEDVSVLDEEIGFGEWMLNDEVRIDDLLYHINDDIPDLAVGDTFESITGPLTYAYDNYKLEPRSFDDFVGYTAVAD